MSDQSTHKWSRKDVEVLARQLHVLDLFEQRRSGNCPDKWAECSEDVREGWRAAARAALDLVADKAVEN